MIYMMPDEDVGIIIRRSRRFLLRLPRHRRSKTALRGIFVIVAQFPKRPRSAPATLPAGFRFQLADGLEAVRGRLQRLVDIGGSVSRRQKHVVLGMKERPVT